MQVARALRGFRSPAEYSRCAPLLLFSAEYRRKQKREPSRYCIRGGGHSPLPCRCRGTARHLLTPRPRYVFYFTFSLISFASHPHCPAVYSPLPSDLHRCGCICVKAIELLHYPHKITVFFFVFCIFVFRQMNA